MKNQAKKPDFFFFKKTKNVKNITIRFCYKYRKNLVITFIYIKGSRKAIALIG